MIVDLKSFQLNSQESNYFKFYNYISVHSLFYNL